MKLEKILTEYGLNKKQANVYLACLELGSASVYKIAQKANLPRSTCYEIIEDLKNKNLVSSFKKKKVCFYTAESPKNIIEQSKKKLELFENALPEFNALYGKSKGRPTVRYYQGTEGMKIILEELLREAKILRGFSSADNLFANLGDYWPKFVKKRVNKKIPAKIIIKDSKLARERKRIGSKELREVRIAPPEYNIKGTVFIWKNKVAFFSYQKEMMALLVESEIIADSQKAIFQALWDKLEK